MPFWYLIWVVQTHLHAKGFVVPMVGTIVYRTFSNYNELCTKYHLLSIFFSIKVVVFQQKESRFQIESIMYWQYILIAFRMGRLHLLLLYVGHCCIIKRPSSFSKQLSHTESGLILAYGYISVSYLLHTNVYRYSTMNKPQPFQAF